VTVTLRVVLDQLVTATDADLAAASHELARALVQSAPSGCDVGAIAPSGEGAVEIAGIGEIHRMGMGRRELAAAWQLGVAPGVGGGLIHSPTLLAPLVRHDRVNDHDQTVVTLWDLRAWEAPEELPRTSSMWQRAMLKRAERHADAVVVPTHAMAERLAASSRLGSRIRVIAGASPASFGVPLDAVGRRRTLAVPDALIVMAGDAAPSSALSAGFAALAEAGADLPVVVLDAGEGEEPAIVDLAAAAGVPERLVHVRGGLDAADRAAVLDAAVLHLAPSRRPAFPWRVVDALALGVPVVAVASADHREVVSEGGLVVGDVGDGEGDAAALATALGEALGSTAALDRLAVLASDRGRAFSWREAAERVWQLHADL
jgi:hypothetical protein